MLLLSLCVTAHAADGVYLIDEPGLLTRDEAETLESRVVPGLYACGEVLDVDGDCGGFNLQWAWSSGHLAGLLL